MSTPTRLGRYAVRRRIGAGGFATVWLCFDEHLDSPVAVKVLADNWSGDQHVRRRFVEEGRFLRKVQSANVVSVYDAGELADGRPFLVMEYADQGNLADRLDQSPVSPAQAIQVIRDVGAGLFALHQRDVLHRDVKPANVLFRTLTDRQPGVPSGDDEHSRLRAMVGDLGLSKALDMSSRLTTIAGTPAFVAPEQARGERLDARADQFSLAALAFLMLEGRPAFAPASLAAAADPPPPPEPGTDLPPAVSAALRRGVSVDPTARFDDIPAFLDELTSAMTDLPSTAGATPEGWPGIATGITRAAAGPLPVSEIIPGVPTAPPTAEGREDVPPAAVPRRRVRWAAAAMLALAAGAAGAAGGWATGQWTAGNHSVRDDSGNLRVSVPASWAGVQATGPWTPPGLERNFSALSVGSEREWQRSPEESGVFLAVLPGSDLPDELPGHGGCSSVQEPVTDRGDPRGPMMTVVSAECLGDSIVIERVVQVADNRLLWVQVQSTDRPAATAVLESVEVAGL